MDTSLVRDAALGQIIRWATKGRLLKYPEEEPNFELPAGYGLTEEKRASSVPLSAASTNAATSPAQEKDIEDVPLTPPSQLERNNTLRNIETAADPEALASTGAERNLSKITSRAQMSHVNTRAELEQAYTNATAQESIKQQQSRPIAPTRTSDGTILVDWYSTTDEANPQNWSHTKKAIVVLQIYFYTLAVYIGSAIITPSQPYIEHKFGISAEVASLGLSMYVLGYGIGPMLFSPLSEMPVIGRNPPYIVTFSIFVLISIGISFVNNFPALIVMRFLQGFFGSPCLATGGASIGDIYSLLRLPYYLTGWAAFATAGPALGPLISGFSVPALNWHFSLWLIVILAVPVYLTLFAILPETSSDNILLRRAARLRKLTGNAALRSQSEINQSKLSVNEIIISNLWRPVQINALDPSVLFTSIYIALMYAIFYSFFEVFPFVYAIGLPRPDSVTKGYGMNAGEIGLIFLSITVGVSIAIPVYAYYLHKVFGPRIKSQGLGAPEWVLVPGLYACFFVPVGLFLFGWTGFNSPQIHWIVPTLGIVLFTIGIFILFQVIFIYIPLTYPQYAASLFAGNDFARSSIAAGAIHFSRPMFLNLGVGPGVSLLAGLTFGGCIGIWTLWYFGAALRARSKFAAK
jgi:MFS transporter, DHA1 family, multidrug resistance protein